MKTLLQYSFVILAVISAPLALENPKVSKYQLISNIGINRGHFDKPLITGNHAPLIQTSRIGLTSEILGGFKVTNQVNLNFGFGFENFGTAYGLIITDKIHTLSERPGINLNYLSVPIFTEILLWSWLDEIAIRVNQYVGFGCLNLFLLTAKYGHSDEFQNFYEDFNKYDIGPLINIKHELILSDLFAIFATGLMYKGLRNLVKCEKGDGCNESKSILFSIKVGLKYYLY